MKKYVIGVFAVAALSLFILWGPPDLLKKTSEPDYCNSCHVMNDRFESWFMTGLHRNIKCVDCHLPNSGYFRHIVWKGIDGMKDLIYFHSGIYSSQIGISDHGRRFVKENCLRCHEGMVSVMDSDDRDCWSCHRSVAHRYPSVGTLK